MSTPFVAALTAPASRPGCVDALALSHPDLYASIYGAGAVGNPLAPGLRAALGNLGTGADCDQVLAALTARKNLIVQGAAGIAGSGMGSLVRQQQRQEALLASDIAAATAGLPLGASVSARAIDAADELARQACASGWANATREQVNLIYDRAEARGIPGARFMTLADVCAAVLEDVARDVAIETAAAQTIAPSPLGSLYGVPAVPYDGPSYRPQPPYGGNVYGPPNAALPVAADAALSAIDAQAQAYDDVSQQLLLQSQVAATRAAEERARLQQAQRAVASASATGAGWYRGASRAW
ncbi:hypothetical protein pmac_cds_95 [Pandoravirus macleodensis]|uniref:Uncharacterized protein n=1 Tax=Pandoravirus macleodensis TaxID=2107707 RepID=A0A2U7UEB9_9VIRU|nr:hypothetical protein pmac_cds_95 [Pandoravirus macleodensis]AVK76783.1 hypothetical protein pmac_cds_95 [Pandoravirus macleodensis]UMO79344.1 hypothetical protein [Pandoravirus aubagnensis]